MTMKLYEIRNEYSQTIEEVDKMIEEGADLDSVTQLLDSVKGAFEEKALSVAGYIKSLETEALSIKEESDKMKIRAQRKMNQAKSLKDYLKYNMQQANCENISSAYFDIKIKENPPKLNDNFDLHDIPLMYKKEEISYKPDKKAIKEALLSGIDIYGCYLIRDKRVEIR